MQSVLTRTSRFTQLFRLRSAQSGAPSTLVATTPPLYQRHPPWWARWTWGLIACDIFLTGSAIELTYNHWSTLKSSTTKGEDASAPHEYVLRPSWQRVGLCTGHLVFGAGLAAALLVAQTRFVRTFAILPPSGSEGRRVFIQCAHNFRKNGIVFPASKASLRDGRNTTEMIFRVDGERGHWYMGFEDSVIHGRRLPLHQARAEVLADWEVKRVETFLPKPRMELDSRWKSGPIRRAGKC
ncbi:hypothetical protein FPV67DRAFT_1017169 [Lyophyllum atratum]|nr:hypothetical protein FPV67DRAFT_1017169 [Lyophyllum atratum]